jgi:hypothetical protein
MIGNEAYGTWKEVTYDTRHGGPFDRGAADSYYGRGVEPHYYAAGTGNSEQINNLTPEELAAYMAGFEWNEKYGDRKDWG